MMEEKIRLLESKSMLLAAAIISILFALVSKSVIHEQQVGVAIRRNFLDCTVSLFFLLVITTYINATLERGVLNQPMTWLL